MDRANYRVITPFHIADTPVKALENVQGRF